MLSALAQLCTGRRSSQDSSTGLGLSTQRRLPGPPHRPSTRPATAAPALHPDASTRRSITEDHQSWPIRPTASRASDVRSGRQPWSNGQADAQTATTNNTWSDRRQVQSISKARGGQQRSTPVTLRRCRTTPRLRQPPCCIGLAARYRGRTALGKTSLSFQPMVRPSAVQPATSQLPSCGQPLRDRRVQAYRICMDSVVGYFRLRDRQVQAYRICLDLVEGHFVFEIDDFRRTGSA